MTWIQVSLMAFAVHLLCGCSIHAYEISELPGEHHTIAEGPHWDNETQSLYYVDILGNGSIYRYDFEEDHTYKGIIPNVTFTGFIIPVEGESGKFVVGADRNVILISWNGKSRSVFVEKLLYQVESEEIYKLNRLNDGKADPNGRVIAGTMSSEEVCEVTHYNTGSLYCFDKRGGETKLQSNISISNGLTWNETNNAFYYIDSCAFNIVEYKWNPETELIRYNKRVIQFEATETQPKYLPDGMTSDNQGNLYVATYGQSTVLKIDQITATILNKYELPTDQITSVAFGGPNLDILFVTTSSNGGKPAPAGNLFKITGIHSTGKIMHKVKL